MMDIAGLENALREGRIDWRKHVLQRLAERGIRQHQVIVVVLSGRGKSRDAARRDPLKCP